MGNHKAGSIFAERFGEPAHDFCSYRHGVGAHVTDIHRSSTKPLSPSLGFRMANTFHTCLTGRRILPGDIGFAILTVATPNQMHRDALGAMKCDRAPATPDE